LSFTFFVFLIIFQISSTSKTTKHLRVFAYQYTQIFRFFSKYHPSKTLLDAEKRWRQKTYV